MKIVRVDARWIQICVLVCALGCADVPAQSQAPTSGSLDSALATEDPNARIAALQKFLKTISTPEQTQAAREAIVASWAQLADVQLGENNIEKAVENFRRASAALPEKITDRFFEETVIRIPLAVSVRGYRNEAIGLARQLEKRFEKEARRLASLGEFYMTIEAPTDAIHALETASKLAEEDARLHRLLGAAYRMGLRLDDAIAEYQLAVNFDANDKRAYYELANLYRAHGAYDDALKLYRKQIEIEPKHSPSYKGLALAHLAQGNEEQMAAALNQARDLRGTAEEITQDIYLQTQLAFYYLSQNKLKQARASAEAALIVEPRYSWARIAAAEVDLAEGKYFEAERNLLAARQYASFPTLYFTVGKLYLVAEDFDGALEQFTKAFSYSPQKQFTAKLGGVLDVQADNLKELLAREHQAAIFLAEPPTTPEIFKIAEALVRFNIHLRIIKTPAPPASRSPRGERSAAKNFVPNEPDAGRKQMEEMDRAAMDFIEVENARRSFRMLHIAERLANAGVAMGLAEELAEQALGLAEVATEPDGSLREYPNYDRDGRLRIFRGRALDAKGWALFKANKNRESIAALTEAVKAYGSLPEGRRAVWHLATVKETEGDLEEALDLYIAGYAPPETGSNIDVNRVVIESLYRKINGSLDGLNQRLGVSTLSSVAQVKSNDTAKPKANDALAKIEPKASKPGSKSSPQFKLPTPPELTKRNDSPIAAPAETITIEAQSPRLVLTAQPDQPAETKPAAAPSKPAPTPTNLPPAPPVAPHTVPIALNPVELPVSLPAAETAATPTAPPPAPVTSPPVELPAITNTQLPPPLKSWVGWVTIFSTFKFFTLQSTVGEEAPPPPPAPTVHTRKRRVTVPDGQPPNS
jgi:tetratricopeptide (TPR) repeat protein